MADPGDCIDLDITLVNVGNAKATGISATLVSNTPGVTIPTATQSYADINAGNTGQNQGSFRVAILNTFPCGDYAHLTLNVTTNQGQFTIPVSVTIGQVITPVNQIFSSSSAPVPVPDADPAGASMPIVVSGVASYDRIKVIIRVTNTYDADLDISLIGPGGSPTTINLSSDNGDDQDNYGTGTICPVDGNDTIFDDKASASIITATAPFVGTFRPEQLLSSFGGNPNGTWTLKVVDDLAEDIGNIVCWSIRFESYSCTTGSGCGAGEPKPAFSVQDKTVSGGNGDNDADKNEIFNLAIEILNDGTADATNVAATLTTTTPGVQILTGAGSYPDTDTGESETNLVPFVLQTPFNMDCGVEIALTLTLNTTQGTFVTSFKLPTGTLSAPATFSSTAPPVNIPDEGATVSMPVNVSGLTGRIGRVTSRIYIPHGCTQDLDIDLAAPNSTAINLASDNGSCLEGGLENYGTDCPASGNDTTFDDSAATQVTAANEPFVGTFLPEQPLSTFNGLTANGTWNLRATDDFVDETGSIACWSAAISTFQCQDGGATTPTFLLFEDFETTGPTMWIGSTNFFQMDGKLQSTAAPKSKIAPPTPWTPSGQSTCSQCTRELDDVDVGPGLKRKLVLTIWSLDKKNQVDVIFKLDSGGGKLLLKQKASGTVAKGSVALPVGTNTPFNFSITYDGTKFDVSINGNVVLSVNSSTPPSGNMLITIKNAAVKIGEARIF